MQTVAVFEKRVLVGRASVPVRLCASAPADWLAEGGAPLIATLHRGARASGAVVAVSAGMKSKSANRFWRM